MERGVGRLRVEVVHELVKVGRKMSGVGHCIAKVGHKPAWNVELVVCGSKSFMNWGKLVVRCRESVIASQKSFMNWGKLVVCASLSDWSISCVLSASSHGNKF